MRSSSGKRRRGGQPGNRNAAGNRGNRNARGREGNCGGGAPFGNHNARKRSRSPVDILKREYAHSAEAIERALDYRAAGDIYLVDADISDCFGSLDHDILMQLVSRRVRDKRMLGLIRMWLDCGQVLPKEPIEETGAQPAGIAGRLGDYAGESVDAAVSQMLQDDLYGDYTALDYENYGSIEDPVTDAGRQARKEVMRRLGRDGLLLLLTSAARAKRWMTPAALALTGAAALAAAMYPKASRYVRRKMAARRGGVGALQGSPLSALLSNIYLHEFDAAMIKAGLHLVRYADDWIICCRDELAAHAAMELAARELHRLKLRLNSEKTRITKFDQSPEFLGYRFHPHLIAAAPAPDDERTPIAKWWKNATGKLKHARIQPAAARLTDGARDRTQEGLDRLKALARRFRKGDDK